MRSRFPMVMGIVQAVVVSVPRRLPTSPFPTLMRRSLPSIGGRPLSPSPLRSTLGEHQGTRASATQVGRSVLVSGENCFW